MFINEPESLFSYCSEIIRKPLTRFHVFQTVLENSVYVMCRKWMKRIRTKCWFCKWKGKRCRSCRSIFTWEELLFLSGIFCVDKLKTQEISVILIQLLFITAQYETWICHSTEGNQPNDQSVLECSTTTGSYICSREKLKGISSHMLEVLRSASIKKLIKLLSSEKTQYGNPVLLERAVFVPDEASLGSVDEVHAVGSEVLPANFIGVVPQRSDLKHTHTDVRVIKKT